MGWIATYTGRQFDYHDMKPEMVCIEDIAHALSNICRYNGHTRSFYSVAQHCVIAASIAPSEVQLEALMHDAAEAYIGDVVSPLKYKLYVAGSYSMEHIDDLESRVVDVIRQKFQFHWPMSSIVKEIDVILALTEKRDLLNNRDRWRIEDKYPHLTPLPETIHPATPSEAKDMFLRRFHELMDRRTPVAVVV